MWPAVCIQCDSCVLASARPFVGRIPRGPTADNWLQYTHPPAPTVSVATVTADGSVTVKTVLVTPTVGINSQGQAGMTSSSNGLSPGAAAGIAVGAIALVIMIAAAIFCCWMQRRRKRETEDGLIGGSVLGRSPGGATSASSPTNMSQTNQFVTNAVVGQELRRQSHLMPVDPRLDYSFGMYADANKSHDSINTIHDERDYSRRLNQPRVLRPTNPDPED